MKKILIYLCILTIFSCSNENPLTESLQKDLITNVTINESNIIGPVRPIPSDPSTLNKSLFEVAIPFSLTNGILNTPASIKKVTVNSIDYDVVKYDCTAELLNGSFTYNIQPGALTLTTIKENNNEVSVFYNDGFHETISKKFSSDLLQRRETIIYLQGTIDNGNLPFEVRLTFNMNTTVEVVQ